MNPLKNYQIKEPKDSRVLFEIALRSAEPQIASKVLRSVGLGSFVVSTLASIKSEKKAAENAMKELETSFSR